MHETLLKCKEYAMHEHIESNQHNLTQKFHKNLKNPKKFQKPQNLGRKCMNAWQIRILGSLPSDLILIKAENAVSGEIWVKKECLEGEKVLVFRPLKTQLI